MNKQVLRPFNCDMCAMIEDITKQEIEVTASDTSIRLSWAQNGSEGNDKAEVVNRNSMEKAFNDTPDFILARIAVEAMEMFTRASAHRDDYHGFRTADYARKHKAICESEKKAKPVNTCKGCPLIDVCPAVQMENQPERKREYKKPEAHDVPKEVEAMAAFFADMFPGSEIQIQRVDLKENPRNKRRAKNQRKNRKGGRNNER